MRMYEDLFIWSIIYMYAIASALLLTGFVFNKQKPLRLASYLIFPAFLLHTAVFAMKWWRTGYFPANGELENSITAGWIAIALTIYLLIKRKSFSGVALFTVPATLLLLGSGILIEPDPLPHLASLKSSWLIVHVLFANMAFGAYAIASGMGLMYVLKDRKLRRGGQGDFYDRFPTLDSIEDNMFRFVLYGFISEAVMLASGAIWAKDLWGSYWGWDPVEVWSLVSWMLYGLAIHLRVTLGWRGRKLAWMMIFLIVTVVIAYWGIDIVVESSRHLFGVTGSSIR